jgi:hypothetical protein
MRGGGRGRQRPDVGQGVVGQGELLQARQPREAQDLLHDIRKGGDEV